MEKVIVILGPTGVGKTKLSIAVAKKFSGEIINGDSMQVYKGMDIGTAKIKEKEMEFIPHHLFDILNINQDNSISDNQIRVRVTIENIIQHHKLPIIVGGTGLYLKSALYDYDFEEIYQHNVEIEVKYQHLNNEELHQYLASFDKVSANKFHPNNRRRILRAIEIYETLGITKEEHEAKQEHKCLYDVLFLGLHAQRVILHKLIDRRVEQMFIEGLEEEVNKLYQTEGFINSTAFQAIGYKEFLPYFNGHVSLLDIKNQIKIHTHQYAKRQYTWFRHQLPVKWIEVDVDNFDNTIKNAFKIIECFLDN